MKKNFELFMRTKCNLAKLIFLVLSSLSIIESFAETKPNSKEVLPVDWKVMKSGRLEISVSKLELEVMSSTRKFKTVCSRKTAVAFDFDNLFVLSLSCVDTYGGLVYLHNPNDLKPRAGIVVGNDFGDEGCSEVTSSKLEWTKDGKLTLKTSTRFSGTLAGGSESDCNPGLKEETFVFEKTKKLFEKSPSPNN